MSKRLSEVEIKHRFAAFLSDELKYKKSVSEKECSQNMSLY